jgi:pyruvate formate lyase activating enzyme
MLRPMSEPFGLALKDGAILCQFCPRGCRLHLGATGRCGALENEACRLIPVRPAGSFRVKTVAADQTGLYKFRDQALVLCVESDGSCLEASKQAADSTPHLSAEQVVFVARAWGAGGIYLSSEDPVFDVGEGREILERAKAAGLVTALATTGYLLPRTREIVLDRVDVVNLRIWSLTQAFYAKRFGARIEPILATAEWLASRRDLAVEVTVPVLPGENDAPAELSRLVHWIGRTFGPDVPIHVEPGESGIWPEVVQGASEIMRASRLRPVAKTRRRRSAAPALPVAAH